MSLQHFLPCSHLAGSYARQFSFHSLADQPLPQSKSTYRCSACLVEVGDITAYIDCRTPCHGRVFDALPPESKMASARLLQPKDPRQQKACVLHLAGTGDHTWSRRMKIGAPLLKQVSSAMYGQCILHHSIYTQAAPVPLPAYQPLQHSQTMLGRQTKPCWEGKPSHAVKANQARIMTMTSGLTAWISKAAIHIRRHAHRCCITK